MIITNNTRHISVHYKNYFLLLVICLLTWWPLTFSIFSVKNDAIHYFLPYRFSISEAIRNGEWPFWSPYIYLGNPVYGDMQSGAWNPVVWFFSCIGRYNLTLFHFENLLYIFLAGAGMYKLTNRLTEHSRTSLLIAVSYMLSGFMLSGQLINWLASAAFFPFVIHNYISLLHTGKYHYTITTAIALFFLLTAGYPSFFITTGYILLLLFLFYAVLSIKNKLNRNWKTFLLQHLLLCVVFIFLALPAIISYADLLPYYQRGNGVSYNEAVINSFEWQHFLSLLLPSTISATDISSTTDITFRNIYLGLFPLIILIAFPPQLNKRNILLICLGIFAILFSLGDITPVRKLCYDYLPLMNTFRHPAQVRIFLIFSLLLLTAPGLKRIITGDSDNMALSKTKFSLVVITCSILLTTIIALAQPDSSSIFKLLKNSTGISSLKTTLDNLHLNQAIVISASIQLLFITGYIIWLRKRNSYLLSSLWIANLFIMAQLALPATFVGMANPKEINAYINNSPAGFPTESLANTLKENSEDATVAFNQISLSYFYNKKIGISKVANSPAFLKQQEEFLNNSVLYDYTASMPAVYIADQTFNLAGTNSLKESNTCHFAVTTYVLNKGNSCDSASKVRISKLSANRFEIETESSTPGFLVLTQNYNHHWKVKTDNKSAEIYKTNLSFMGTPLQPGKHLIVFEFKPVNTIAAIWVMAGSIILLLTAWLIVLLIKRRESIFTK